MEPASPSPSPEPLDLPAGVHSLCSCGRSRHGWFCDGAHLGTGRVAYELKLEQAATVLLCRCGRSRRYPLCDGRHATGNRPRWRFWGFARQDQKGPPQP
ncbi:MAG: CDGSH iron-sulfur domain-containing protein [Cyanobacteriota bacterium]|nr:CDGSH iron-sulfur domain-containing protein [Cyanobacteriota bacterium]